jgi:hypothetical protein
MAQDSIVMQAPANTARNYPPLINSLVAFNFPAAVVSVSLANSNAQKDFILIHIYF